MILVLVAGICGGCELYTGRITADFGRMLLPVAQAVTAGNWQQAVQQADTIVQRWEKQCAIVQLWVNHADTDAVFHALKGLQTALRERDRLTALLYYDECNENFAHLHHRDAFTLKNIL